MALTKQEILKQANEENVSFIRLQFTDLLGTIKNVEIPLSQLEKALDNKIMVRRFFHRRVCPYRGIGHVPLSRSRHLGDFPVDNR